jgi:xanthine/uracil permease
MDDASADRLKLLYGLNDRPPWGRLGLYGLQWLCIFLPVLAMTAALIGDASGLNAAEESALFGRVCLLSGLTMLVQTTAGHRLPLIDGPAMALILTTAAMSTAGEGVVEGGLLVGGLLTFLLGVFGWLRYIGRLFTDRVIGVILLLIGLSALPYLLPMVSGVDAAHPAGRPAILGLSMVLVAVMVLLAHYLTGVFKSLSILIGIALGTALFAALGLVDVSTVGRKPWMAMPDLGAGAWPRFHPAAVFSFAVAYLAVVVNAMGSVYSLEPVVGPERIDRRLNRGLAVTGLAGMAAGLGGAVGLVPYSNSPGVIAVTRVGTRWALTVAGGLLVLLAVFGKITALITAVPEAVVGAALVTALAAQIGVGIEIIHRGDAPLSGREYLVIGLPIPLGAAAAFLPDALLDQLPALVRVWAGNGLVVGLVAVLILEHALLRRNQD